MISSTCPNKVISPTCPNKNMSCNLIFPHPFSHTKKVGKHETGTNKRISCNSMLIGQCSKHKLIVQNFKCHFISKSLNRQGKLVSLPRADTLALMLSLLASAGKVGVGDIVGAVGFGFWWASLGTASCWLSTMSSVLQSSVGVGSVVALNCRRLRRYRVPSHSTLYDLGPAWHRTFPCDQVVAPGRCIRMDSPGWSMCSALAPLLK